MMSKKQHPSHIDFPFAVEIEGIAAGWFTECSGLSIERDVTPLPEGGVNDFVHQLPGPVTHTNITLKHGLVDNTLWNWFQQGVVDGHVAPHNVSVILYNPDGTEATRWDLPQAYPVKWSADSLQTDSRQTLLETVELTQQGSTTGGETIFRKTDSTVVQRMMHTSDKQPDSNDKDLDLPLLAKKIYHLLQQELRVEKDRRGRYR